ncbi:MAG TPA: aerial mycelium formation protein [Actinomycetota bacterium]|nr:aerial mycelium formation protein [Actinomycetota bacterium]
MSAAEGKRRIDRVLSPGFVEGLEGLSLTELRARRDDCLAEREYLSLLRRLVQGRAEILAAELEARRGAERAPEPLTERLARILAPDDARAPSRGEAVRVAVPEPEVLAARRRVERLVADAGLSDPSALSDAELERAVALLEAEEREVSRQRAAVIAVLDALQEELKRRYREDLSQVLS